MCARDATGEVRDGGDQCRPHFGRRVSVGPVITARMEAQGGHVVQGTSASLLAPPRVRLHRTQLAYVPHRAQSGQHRELSCHAHPYEHCRRGGAWRKVSQFWVLNPQSMTAPYRMSTLIPE